MLWRRLAHPGLKYVAVALAVAVTFRLVTHEVMLGIYARPLWRLVNGLSATVLVPALAFAGASAMLVRDEVARLRSWEKETIGGRDVPIAAGAIGLAAVVVGFLWINVAVADWFAVGPTLEVTLGDAPARALTTSIAWALYARALLALGMSRGTVLLRWVSLGFLLGAIGKVFLYDLGELGDLYRVASLLGLAASLLLVSFAYQRFVFRPVAILVPMLADPTALAAEATTTPLALFPMQAHIIADAPGLSRLPLPPEVLAASRGDLSDVRIVDGEGAQVPFLVDTGRGAEADRR